MVFNLLEALCAGAFLLLITLQVFPCCRHTPHAVVYIVCSPDDGHNNARNMLS